MKLILVHGEGRPILNMARDVRISRERSQLVLIKQGRVYEPQATAYYNLRIKRLVDKVTGKE